MKINIIYLFWILLLGAGFLIGKRLQNQSFHQIFGIANAEGQILRIEDAVLIQKSYVKSGIKVKKGDTLMLLFRNELDKQSVESGTQLSQISAERDARNTAIEREKEVFVLRQNARIVDLQAQIKALEVQIDLQNKLKQAISENNTNNNNLKLQDIVALKESIRQVELQSIEQLKLYDNQRVSNNSITNIKSEQILNVTKYIGKERQKLVLLAPFDGLIEDVFVVQNEVAAAFKDLIKINPQQPNKVTGFVHEALNLPYQLGDTVLLQSVLRPTVTYKAQVVGASTEVAELPFRLRKYTEVKTWGRELFVNLPPQNEFFIGEKIIIKFKN